jgi:alpha-galactosidase
MITVDNDLFCLHGSNISYIMRKTKFGHLEHIWFGERMPVGADVDSLVLKHSVTAGGTVNYDESDETYSLDLLMLEWTSAGKGDFRVLPFELVMPDGSRVCDFVFEQAEQGVGVVPLIGLPQAHDLNDDNACGDHDNVTDVNPEHLIITMRDRVCDIRIKLIYTLWPECDVITRRVELLNDSDSAVEIRRLMSFMLDLVDRRFVLTSLHGSWIREGQRQETVLPVGVVASGSTTGNSSHRHNPAFAIAERSADEMQGRVYGFNLIYSGNHIKFVEKSEFGLVRLMSGINPDGFCWHLAAGEKFAAPEAVLTFSDQGYNGMSHNLHRFVHDHIIPPAWRGRERPILANSWEAYYFNFNQSKLLRLAKQAASLGIELLVLDDGWFGKRNDDRSGLGDYNINTRKLPSGLSGLATKINNMGLQFGLWFEPEMISPDSDLYRAHPEYAVQVPGRDPSLGRHQLVLDLCQPEVRDYIVESVGKILDEVAISYVKWDMNRHMSDVFSVVLKEQGEFYHRYIIGLYEVLERIFKPRPDVLLESCASGGNRFDLGMLCFSPQIWTSDNIDPIERLTIQGGMSLFFPLSTMGSHVADSPHSQTLRHTTLATRFHLAAFGCLGYEFNLNFLNRLQRKEIAEQIEFYKKHRLTFQFGRFYRLPPAKDNKIHWQVVAEDGRESIAGYYQTWQRAAEGCDLLPLTGLDPRQTYRLSTRPLRLELERFGGLINHMLPVQIKPDNPLLRLTGKFYTLPDSAESYTATGRQLQVGVMLNTHYSGTGYNSNVRMLGDFGSHMYLIEAIIDKQSNQEDAQ